MKTNKGELSVVSREHSDLVTSEGKHSFRYGSETITFLRIPKRKGSTKISIRVLPDGFVEVLAPDETSDAEVIAAVRERARWIYAKLKSLEGTKAPLQSTLYVSGTSHFYLGRRHQLKVFCDPLGIEQVKLLRGKFELTVHHRLEHRVKSVLNRWYETRAKDVFERRLGECLPKALWVTERPNIKVSWMEKQWGNCSRTGQLTLNINLVKASRECIDYVICHELCHIAEHNHSPRFYRLLTQVIPGWEEVKERLDNKAKLF